MTTSEKSWRCHAGLQHLLEWRQTQHTQHTYTNESLLRRLNTHVVPIGGRITTSAYQAEWWGQKPNFCGICPSFLCVNVHWCPNVLDLSLMIQLPIFQIGKGYVSNWSSTSHIRNTFPIHEPLSSVILWKWLTSMEYQIFHKYNWSTQCRHFLIGN